MVAPSATPGTNYHFPSPQVVAAEAEMLQIINNHRASLGYPALSRVVTLDLAQRDWAVQMVLSNQCYHGDYGARALSEGYTQFVWGEVGACGHMSAQSAFQGWINSPAHKAIIEECCEMNDVGIGAWRYPNGAYTFWVVLADRD
jgi:uncharacterized protein YkwD